MFSSSSPTNIEDVCQVVKGKIIMDKQLWCEATYSLEKVPEALNQMNPLKASGPKGLSALCFLKKLEQYGDGVMNLVLGLMKKIKILLPSRRLTSF